MWLPSTAVASLLRVQCAVDDIMAAISAATQQSLVRVPVVPFVVIVREPRFHVLALVLHSSSETVRYTKGKILRA